MAIIAGCIFRFANLDKKVYSHDETLTSLRTSGYLFSEFEHSVADRVLTVARLQSFQHANPERGITSTIRALALDDPQHPPLYYILDRAWSTLFADSIAGRRSLGALFGVLGIAALYWLCRELWPVNKAWAITAAGLFAVSPFQLQYAQQAREYTLWELLTIVSCALLIRAQRQGALHSWVFYALSVVTGLYTFLFFFLVMLAQLIYILLMERLRLSRVSRAFLVSALLAVTAYLPWLINLAAQRNTVVETNTWFSTPVPAVVYIYKWLFNIGAVFFDAEYVNVLWSVILLPVAALAAWSLFLTARSNVKPIAILTVALFGAVVLPILIPDLVLHQSRATAARYLAPAWIAIDLAVAYALCVLSANRSRFPLANIFLVCLIGMGVVSWAVSAPAKAWWPASSEEPLLSIVSTLSDRPAALIATSDAAMALNLSNYLSPADRFDFTAKPSMETLRRASADGVYLIAPTSNLLSAIEQTADLRTDIAYQSLDIDSPMLRGTARLGIPALRSQLAASRVKAGLTQVDFSVWKVTSSSNARAGRTIVERVRRDAAKIKSLEECVPPLGSWVDLQATNATCRPFAAMSPLNRPIPAHAKLMPNSANMIKYLLTKTGGPPGTFTAKCAVGTDRACAGEHTDYGHPVYAGQKTDPIWTIHCTNPFGGNCTAEGARIHIPANARPAGGTDHHFGVIDQASGLEYDFWGFCFGGPAFRNSAEATDEPLTVADCDKKYGGKLQVRTAAIYDLDSNGIWSSHLAGRKQMEPADQATATASGIALYGGAARVNEFKDGAYPHHAGFMVLPCSNGSAVYPISHFDTPCSEFKATNPPCSWDSQGNCGIPYGARWFIDLSDDAIDACTDGGKPCLGPVKATLKMLAHYGMYFADTNGDYGWALNGVFDDWATQSRFGTVPTYTYFASQGLKKLDSSGNLVVSWPSWMDENWFAIHSHFADPCVTRADC